MLGPVAAQASASLPSTRTAAAQTVAAAAPPVATTAPDVAVSAPVEAASPAPVAAAAPVEAASPTEAATPTEAAAPDPVATAAPASDAAVTPTPATTDLSVTIAPAPPTATATPPEALGHLPSWVQIVVASGSLYTADSSSDQVLDKLPRYTFLHVLGGGASRLQVQAYNDSGTPGQTGWVSAEQVLPSAGATDWLVAASATSVWSSSDASASEVLKVSRFSPLQRLDVNGPPSDRVLVNVYSSDFTKVLGSGWIDLSATGPALPPQTRVAGPSDRALAERSLGGLDQAAFLQAAGAAARQGQAATGVPASVTVAQAILESDWGRSTLTVDANNYFGMKVLGTLGNDGLVWMPTSEYDSAGHLYQTTSAFRAYKSLTDSVIDHDRLLQLASRYSAAMKSTKDPKQFAALIAQEGYSTDPSYSDKLVGLMDKYNLYQFDA